MHYIIPFADQEAGRFYLPLPPGRTELLLPLNSNHADLLHSVAGWLNIPISKKETKEVLVNAINTRLSLIPMETAMEKWPALLDQKALATKSRLAELRDSIARETPELLPHLDIRVEAAKAEERMRRRRLGLPPVWYDHVLQDPPVGPHYRIHIRRDTQDHDGYCSDGEELQIVDSMTCIVFLPRVSDKELDLDDDDREWYTYSDDMRSHNGFCNAAEVNLVTNIEVVSV